MPALSAQNYAWGVRALRFEEIEVRIDEAAARRELRLRAEPEALAPAEARSSAARSIYASYREAIANEGQLTLTASLFESQVLRFWLQAEVAFERARFFGLEAGSQGTAEPASLMGWRDLLAELAVAARSGGLVEARTTLLTALAGAEWAPRSMTEEETRLVDARLRALKESSRWEREPLALAGSAWGRHAHRMDLALALGSAEGAELSEFQSLLERRPTQRAAFHRWASLEHLWRGPVANGLLVGGDVADGLYRRRVPSWPVMIEGDARSDIAASLRTAMRSDALDFPAQRASAWHQLWSDVDAQITQRLDDHGALEALARATVRQAIGGGDSAPRIPQVPPFAPVPLAIPEQEEELWLAPELGAVPHAAYLRRAADGFGALAEALEARLGPELLPALRCWTDDAKVGLDFLGELRHLEDLHRGALAWVCDQLGLDWARTGEEKLYRALGRRDYTSRFAKEIAEDPLLKGDLRRVIAVEQADGRFLCRGCVGVAVWHGVLRYSEPPPVTLYGEDGNVLREAPFAVGFQDAPIRLPQEIWLRFECERAPDDERWRREIVAATSMDELRDRIEGGLFDLKEKPPPGK